MAVLRYIVPYPAKGGPLGLYRYSLVAVICIVLIVTDHDCEFCIAVFCSELPIEFPCVKREVLHITQWFTRSVVAFYDQNAIQSLKGVTD